MPQARRARVQITYNGKDITRDIAPGAIVLLHEGAAHGHNVAILAQLLAWLDAEGYRTVVPDEDVQRDTSIVTA